MAEVDKILEHYIKIFKKNSKSINPLVLTFFEEAIQKHPIENILKSIDKTFEELKDKSHIHPAILVKTLQKHLEPEKSEKKTQSSPTMTEDRTKKMIQIQSDYQSRAVWNNLFSELKINEEEIIDKKELSEIPEDIRNFYISAKVADYLYERLSEEERKKIENMVEKRMKILSLSSQKEKEEAKVLLVRYFVKKFYGIPF